MFCLWCNDIKKKFQDVETFVYELHDGRHWIPETEYVVQQYGTSGVVCGGDNVSERPKHPRLIAGGARTEGVGGDERSECLEDFISAT